MEIIMLTVGQVCTNCYIIHQEGTNSCVVIDPGDEAKKIADQIRKNGWDCEGILLTHGHFDHITGVSDLVSYVGGKVYAYREELDVLKDPHLNASAMAGYEVAIEPEMLTVRNLRLPDLYSVSFIRRGIRKADAVIMKKKRRLCLVEILFSWNQLAERICRPGIRHSC